MASAFSCAALRAGPCSHLPARHTALSPDPWHPDASSKALAPHSLKKSLASVLTLSVRFRDSVLAGESPLSTRPGCPGARASRCTQPVRGHRLRLRAEHQNQGAGRQCAEPRASEAPLCVWAGAAEGPFIYHPTIVSYESLLGAGHSTRC